MLSTSDQDGRLPIRLAPCNNLARVNRYRQSVR